MFGGVLVRTGRDGLEGVTRGLCGENKGGRMRKE
jgi:hypothetical protein